MVRKAVRARRWTVVPARRWRAVVATGAFLLLPATASAAASSASAIPSNAVPGELIVTFTHGTSAAKRETLIGQRGARVIRSFPRLTMDLVRFGTASTPGAVPQTTVNALAREPGVVAVQPNYIVHAAFTPNDPDVPQQWALPKIGAFGAWDVNQGSANTKIAIVDTGIDTTQPDLAGKVVGGVDYADANNSYEDNNGHGTHVAGIAAADTNNGTLIAGMCPNCKLLAVKVLDASGSGTTANVISGITWAASHGANVINLSLAGTASPALDDAVNNAWASGVFASCAAGNNGNTTKVSPAEAADCFAVASTNSTDAKSSFSDYGTWVKGAAPGETIISTWDVSPFYKTLSGTSMAAPQVSGLAGLLASSETNAEISTTICNTADHITGTGTDWTCGRIDAAAALDSIAPSTSLQLTPSTPNGNNGWYRSVHVTATGTAKAGSTTIASIRCELNPSTAPTVFSSLPSGCAYGGSGAEVTTDGSDAVYGASEDSGGNEGLPASVSFKLDSTPPKLVCGSPGTSWHAQNVSIPCTASDATSGLADSADAAFTLTTSVPAGSATSDASTDSVNVCDNAGNCAQAGPINGVKVDRANPTVTLTTPPDGAKYNPLLAPLFAEVTARYACADGDSGIASCTGSVSDGSPFLVGSAPFGSYTFTVTATDQVGNTASVTHSYVLTGTGQLLLKCSAPSKRAHQKCGPTLASGKGKQHGAVLSATLERRKTRFAKGTATRARHGEQALLTPVRVLSPGRYTLLLTRHHRTIDTVAITIS